MLISERLQAEVTILQRELKEIKEINNKHEGRASGKQVILKGKTVLTTEAVFKASEDAEKATVAKRQKGKKGRQSKNIKRK